MQDRERPETWTVRPGDNPWTIARKLYPDAPSEDIPEIAMQIMEANGINRPDRMQPDQILMVPDRGLAISDETRQVFNADAMRIAALQQGATASPASPTYENLFIFGGGWDGYGPSGLRSKNAQDLKREFPGSSTITHDRFEHDRESLVAEIVAFHESTGEPVDLIGHSWGGMDAYQVARELTARGVPVGTLVTADPVGRWPRGDLPERINWINITADPRNRLSKDNLAAEAGGKPSALRSAMPIQMPWLPPTTAISSA